MVKLFIGNLAETVDSTRLKQVFQRFTKVTECDVVKNYAFIHVEEDDVEEIIKRLDGYIFDGKAIQIKVSTSKLRPVAGMINQCFRCSSTTHRTPQCPDDPLNQASHTIKIDLTQSAKRPLVPVTDLSSSIFGAPEAKRPAPAPAPAVPYYTGPMYSGDPEIPRPPEMDLQQLYEEYNLSRQRYMYHRERLMKEIEARRGQGSMAGYAIAMPAAVPQMPNGVSSVASNPVAYGQGAPPQQHAVPMPVSFSAASIHPAMSAAVVSATPQYPTTPLKAPYASATVQAPAAPYSSPQPAGVMHPGQMQQIPGQPALVQNSNPLTMTAQQFLQQSMAQGQQVPLTSNMGNPMTPSSQPVYAGQQMQPQMMYQQQQQVHPSQAQTVTMGGGLVKLNLA